MLPHHEVPTRLHRGALAAARGLWLGLSALGIVLFVANLPGQYAFYRTVCISGQCESLQLTPELARQLTQLGLSVDSYALYFTLVSVVEGLGFLLIGTVIFWHRSDDWVALYVSLMLILWQSGGGPTPGVILNPTMRLIAMLVGALANSLIILFFLVFPDGRFVPRWIRWLAPFLVLREVLGVFLKDAVLVRDLFFVVVPIALFAQIYRYRRVATSVQRQQTKWVVFGVTVGVVGFAGTLLIYSFLYPNAQPNNVLASVLGETLISLFLLFVPLSIGMAMLRSHLWDVDLIIRKTLVYAALSVSLVLVYFASVVLLQEIFGHLVGGERSPLAQAISTLAIAALFAPLRRWLQNWIDRRFYRRKYDAQQTLAQFALAARNETNLDALTGELSRLVQETVHPEHVSVWIGFETGSGTQRFKGETMELDGPTQAALSGRRA